MTNVVKQSLEENASTILKELPEEFHADFKASINEAKPLPVLSEEQAKAEAIACIKENPTISNEDEAIELIKADNTIGQPIPQPSQNELEQQQKASLAEVQANLDD